jgi:hypothetical protein
MSATHWSPATIRSAGGVPHTFRPEARVRRASRPGGRRPGWPAPLPNELRSLGYPAMKCLGASLIGQIPPSAPSQYSKGIWLSAKFPFFVKTGRVAKKWLAGFFEGTAGVEPLKMVMEGRKHTIFPVPR